MVPPPRHHATVVLASLLTPRDHLPVGIRHLGAARPRRIVSSPGHGRRRRSTVDRTAGGSARNARVAHRRQRAADPRFRGRDKSTSGVGAAVPQQRSGEGHRSTGNEDRLVHREDHFFAPVVVPGGISSNSIITSESRSTLVAPSGALNAKASASAIGSVFQSLIRSVYCGAPAIVLLVITYLRGIGWARSESRSANPCRA